MNTAYGDGPDGARSLAETVDAVLRGDRPVMRPFYAPGTATEEALSTVAHDVYGARGVTLEKGARTTLRRFAQAGYDRLPVCVAKTQYSLTDDPAVRGVPVDPWQLHVREFRLSAGAGFVVALTGDILTMPGLPKDPQALRIRASATGEVTGIR